jgi:acetoin utilization protein AcuB
MLMPPISRYMTRQPWTIRSDATLAQAHRLMREHRIRHVPVLEARKLVGIVSQRDLHLLETLPDCAPEEVAVEEAMTQEVYTVSPEAPVDTVVEQMSKHKYGSVVVMNRRGGIEGIFTSVDALQLLADVLRRATA